MATYTGNINNNILTGGAGNDTLIGGGGNDTLNGGAGLDRIISAGDCDFSLTNAALLRGTVQVYSSGTINLAIPDGSLIGVSSSLNVTAKNVVKDIRVNLNINHFFNPDLAVHLVHGTKDIVIAENVGGSNFSNITFDDNGSNVFSAENAPTSGSSYKPVNLLSAFNNLDSSGAWKLKIIDSSETTSGTLKSWSLTVITPETNTLTSIEAATLTGGINNNILDASSFTAGNLILQGLAGDDVLKGGSGADTLNGGSGNDLLIGGAGNDSYTVDAIDDVITEAATPGQIDSVYASVNWTLGDNLENLILQGTATDGTGNALSNLLVGNSLANHLDGGLGIDTMSGRAGNDIYEINATGDKVLETGTSATEIDTANASATWKLSNNVENLHLIGSADINGTGNALNNEIIGNLGSNILAGGNGNDSVDGGSAADILYGGPGNDVLTDTATVSDVPGTNIFTEYDNNPATLVSALLGENSGLTVSNLSYTGAKKSSSTFSAVNFNTPDSDSSNGTMALSKGILLTCGDGTPPIANGSTGYSTSVGGAGDPAMTDIVHTVFPGAGDTNDATVLQFDFHTNDATAKYISLDMMFGSDEYPEYSSKFADIGAIFVDGVNYALFNNDPSHPLAIVNNNLSYFADNTNDTYKIEYDGISKALRITVPVTGGGNHTIRIGVADTGDSALDTGLFVSNLHVTKAPGGGIGLISNNDLLDGGTGADIMDGGIGNDTYIVDNPGDKVTEAGTSLDEIDTVKSSLSWTLGANLEKLVLTGANAINGTGNGLANVIGGNAAANTLTGRGGNDIFNGADGNDILIGNTDNDIFNGGNGSDWAYYNNATAGVTADLKIVGLQDTIGAGSDKFISIENLLGSGYKDTLTGNPLANAIKAGAGADMINGWGGNDILTGNVGADIFRFSTATGVSNIDQITDFSAADDTIQLENAIFTSLKTLGVLNADYFKAGAGLTAATDANDYLVYNSTSGDLYYDAGGNTGAAAVKIAVLGTHPVLTNADFIVT